MQITCTLLQTDNHASTSLFNFLLAGCSFWCPTNNVKALEANNNDSNTTTMFIGCHNGKAIVRVHPVHLMNAY